MVDIQKLLTHIIKNPLEHAKWLNTLSCMENCGAKLIAGSEHPSMVPKEVLKHAAEEFRHAYFFKSQIEKVVCNPLLTYTPKELLGGVLSKQYLYQLNARISRFLKKEKRVNREQLKEYSYLLVTYAIEIRAEKIYPLYQSLLQKFSIKLSILNIIRDEKQHLKEITEELRKTPAAKWVVDIVQIEKELFDQWVERVHKEVLKRQFKLKLFDHKISRLPFSTA